MRGKPGDMGNTEKREDRKAEAQVRREMEKGARDGGREGIRCRGNPENQGPSSMRR